MVVFSSVKEWESAQKEQSKGEIEKVMWGVILARFCGASIIFYH